MRRPAGLGAAAGVLLVVLGGVVLARADTSPGAFPGPGTPLRPGGAYRSELHLGFDDDGWTQLWSRAHVVGLGLLVLGLLLLAFLAGRRRGRRARPGVREARGALALGAVGLLLVVAGIAVVLVTEPHTVVVYSGSHEPAGCPAWPVCGDPPWRTVVHGGRLTGLALAVVGALVLAGVSGRLLAADQRVDQA
jgi:hypothetical protein